MRTEQLLVSVLPGFPTAAEFFLLPDKQLTDGRADKTAAHLEQVRTQRETAAHLERVRTEI